jgi:hypothetical protein
MSKRYTWDYQLKIPPYDKIISVIDAFFSSYPKGDYFCENRERYKLKFRRGNWRRAWFGLGEKIPDRLPKGQFHQWPIIVQVLVRPSPETFLITIRYDLYLPKDMPGLTEDVQASVDQHIRVELSDLATYLGECVGSSEPPRVTTTSS